MRYSVNVAHKTLVSEVIDCYQDHLMEANNGFFNTEPLMDLHYNSLQVLDNTIKWLSTSCPKI